jgi:hypothetical protein
MSRSPPIQTTTAKQSHHGVQVNAGSNFSPKLCKAQQLCHLHYRKFLMNQKGQYGRKTILVRTIDIRANRNSLPSKLRETKNEKNQDPPDVANLPQKLSDCKVVFFSKARNIMTIPSTRTSLSDGRDGQHTRKNHNNTRFPSLKT